MQLQHTAMQTGRTSHLLHDSSSKIRKAPAIHDSRLITGLYNGSVNIYNHQTGAMEKTLKCLKCTFDDR